MNTIATPRSRSCSRRSSRRSRRGLGERARRLVEDEHARVGRDRARDLDLLLQLDRAASPTRARASTWTPSSVERLARRGGARAGQSIAPRRRGSRPIRMFSATVSVGASVSSWLIATMPCSIACARTREADRLAVDARSCRHRAGARRRGSSRASTCPSRSRRRARGSRRRSSSKSTPSSASTPGNDLRDAPVSRTSGPSAGLLPPARSPHVARRLPVSTFARTACRRANDVACGDRLDDLRVLGGGIAGGGRPAERGYARSIRLVHVEPAVHLGDDRVPGRSTISLVEARGSRAGTRACRASSPSRPATSVRCEQHAERGELAGREGAGAACSTAKSSSAQPRVERVAAPARS